MRPPINFNTRRMRFDQMRRRSTNRLIAALSILATILVIAPLLAILGYLIYKGASSLNFAFFTQIPKPVGEDGGGMANSIVGSGVVLALASLMGIPVGIAAGVYLAEFGCGKFFATAVRFTADVLNGVPSIVMGIAIYSLIVMQHKHFSAACSPSPASPERLPHSSSPPSATSSGASSSTSPSPPCRCKSTSMPPAPTTNGIVSPGPVRSS
jgi:phosphate transport system permease protein